MRVESPRFKGARGEVTCEECPCDDYPGVACSAWWYRNGDTDDLRCPSNMEDYAAACLMAEEAAKGGKG